MSMWKGHKDTKEGFLDMGKKWVGKLGITKKTLMEGAKKTEIPTNRGKIKA